jgi:hypothetical protein
VIGQQGSHSGSLVGRCRHDHEVDKPGGGQAAHGVHQQRHAAEQPQRLRRSRTEALAAPGSRHDGRNLAVTLLRAACHAVGPTG